MHPNQLTKKADSCTKTYKNLRNENPKMSCDEIDYIIDNGKCTSCFEYVGEDELVDPARTVCGVCYDKEVIH